VKSYLFGPVTSRRLGVSLGVDCVPFKTCSLNCVFCECGVTTRRTGERREYVPTADVIRELDQYLQTEPLLDHITFSGGGEPTLHSGIGDIIGFLKDRWPRYPVAVLTNGTLLGDPAVRRDCVRADVVVPTLVGVTETVFRKILRPRQGITAASLIQGIRAFRQEFSNTLILELFIIPGINDTPEELALIRECAATLGADRIQLNSLSRPGAESWVQPATPERLREIGEFLKPLDVEILQSGSTGSGESGVSRRSSGSPS
jgi:wyosine [tRNA(Phe)-imidazoG37] synthetase (radical SAM superfamily)